jgi:hypothetical protein
VQVVPLLMLGPSWQVRDSGGTHTITGSLALPGDKIPLETGWENLRHKK